MTDGRSGYATGRWQDGGLLWSGGAAGSCAAGAGNAASKWHSEFEGNLTRRFARQLGSGARVMTISAVARREGIGWHKVMALVSSWSALVAARRRRRRCGVLLVDERRPSGGAASMRL